MSMTSAQFASLIAKFSGVTELKNYFEDVRNSIDTKVATARGLIDAYIVEANSIHPIPYNRVDARFYDSFKSVSDSGTFDPDSFGSRTNGSTFSLAATISFSSANTDPLAIEFLTASKGTSYPTASHILKVTAGVGTTYKSTISQGDVYRTNNVATVATSNKKLTYAAWIKAGNKDIYIHHLAKKNGVAVSTVAEKTIKPSDGVVHCLMHYKSSGWGSYFVSTVAAAPGEEFYVWSPYLANGVVNVLPSNHVDVIMGKNGHA